MGRVGRWDAGRLIARRRAPSHHRPTALGIARSAATFPDSPAGTLWRGLVWFVAASTTATEDRSAGLEDAISVNFHLAPEAFDVRFESRGFVVAVLDPRNGGEETTHRAVLQDRDTFVKQGRVRLVSCFHICSTQVVVATARPLRRLREQASALGMSN